MITQCFPPTPGGIQNVMAHLASALNPHTNLQVITDRLTFLKKAHTAWDAQQPYTIHRVGGPKSFRKWQKQRLLKKIAQQHPHTVLITDSWKSAEYLVHLANVLQLPTISLAHGNDVLTQNRAKKRLRIENTLRLVHQVVAVSNDTQQRVQALGIDHCRVIHNGVALAQQDQPHIAPARKTHDPHLLTIARLEPRKGHDQVLSALAKLKERWPKIHYTIAGDGHDLARLKALTASLHLTAHVTFAGQVNDQEKTELLHRADLFVMPVRHDTTTHSIEGFGMALAEAQLAGCPVLTGQAGGVLDVVKDQDTGHTCDGNDPDSVYHAIEQMLTHPEHTAACALRAKKHAETHFTVAAMTRQYLQLMHSMMDDTHSRCTLRVIQTR